MNVTGTPLVTFVTGIPHLIPPAAIASVTAMPLVGAVAVTSVTGSPPAATVMTAVAMLLVPAVVMAVVVVARLVVAVTRLGNRVRGQ